MGESMKRGGRHAIIDATEEQKMRDLGIPVRCCDYWPECSHVLAWVESQEGLGAGDAQNEAVEPSQGERTVRADASSLSVSASPAPNSSKNPQSKEGAVT